MRFGEASATVMAVDRDRAAVGLVCAEHGAQDLGAARAEQAGKAEDFAGIEIEGDVAEQAAARQIPDLEHRPHLAIDRDARRPLGVGDVAEHHVDDLARRGVWACRSRRSARRRAAPRSRRRSRTVHSCDG